MGIIDRFHKIPNDVMKSVADQIKLLSWAVGGINGYFRHTLGEILGVIFIIVTWGFLQFFAHYLLYNVKCQNNLEDQ
ncbi:MAG: hypothetical protein ACK5Z5_05620 [Neisseriaceae bacterium]